MEMFVWANRWFPIYAIRSTLIGFNFFFLVCAKIQTGTFLNKCGSFSQLVKVFSIRFRVVFFSFLIFFHFAILRIFSITQHVMTFIPSCVLRNFSSLHITHICHYAFDRYHCSDHCPFNILLNTKYVTNHSKQINSMQKRTVHCSAARQKMKYSQTIG